MRTSCLFALVLSSQLALSACGGPPEGAREAQQHLRSGNYDAAEAAADKTLARHPDDATSWRVKIRTEMARGDLSAAAALYQEWRELRGSHDPETYRMMATTSLWQSLAVPGADIRTRAIQIVERHEIEKLAEAVRDLLSDDHDLVAAAAASALLTSHPAAPRLATELLRSEDERARALVVTGIGKKVGRFAHGDIVPMLGDSSPRVRRAAVSAIAHWRSNKDRSLLVDLASKDADGQVRSQALRALARLPGDDHGDIGIKALDDSYLGARVAAVSLVERDASSDTTSVLEKLVSSADIPVALRAAIALHKRDNRSCLEVVERAYASSDWGARAAALNTAAECTGPEEALRFAGRGMADARLDVRLTAARSLLRQGASEPALRALRLALSADVLSPRLVAAADLARLGERDAIDLLSRMARTGNAEQREQAIAAHRTAGVVSDGLVAALGDENISVRLAAADVLMD